jgi:hypothetical protein
MTTDICVTCRNHNHVFSSFIYVQMTTDICVTSNTYICGHLYIDEWGEDMVVITTSNTYICGHLYIDK